MNTKKALVKRIYKKHLMNVEERDAYDKERAEERFIKQKRQNKKLKKPLNDK